MKRTIGFFCFVVVVGCCAEANRAKEPSPEDVYNQISIKNTVYSNAYVDGECRCCHLYGKELKECLCSLDQEELCKHFIALNARRIKQYLLSLSVQEYKEFLSLWTDEQWQEMVAQLSDRQKAVIPATKQELMALIAQAELCSWEEVISRGGHVVFRGGLMVASVHNPVAAALLVLDSYQEMDARKKAEKQRSKAFEELKYKFYETKA